MPIDLRRCAEAAAHAALAEAFAPAEAKPRRRTRRRRRPVRAVLLGAGLVTTARVALNPQMRRELFEAVVRHLPQELIDEFVLEADVVPDEADGDAPAAAEAERDGPDAEPGGAAEKRAASNKPARKAASSPPQSRRRVSRPRGDSNGQSKRTPPNRGTRA